MGCIVSKPGHETTVEHCRARCRLLSEAIKYRYSMADAHAAYALSLRSLASSLHAFLLPSLSHVPPEVSQTDMPSGRSHIQFDSARSELCHNDLEVISEIKKQFERAADVVEAVATVLETGKPHYHFKDSITKVAVRLNCGLPSIPNFIEDESNYEAFNAMGNNSSLSVTLQKLYAWETKLLEEVQNEEKYHRKCNEFNSSDKKGSDLEKIDEIRSSIRNPTRIIIVLQVLDRISNKISEIREEELWPQICELVQKLMKMWEIMLECHQAQLHAISQAKALDSIFFSGTHLSYSQMESTKQLQLDLLSWLTSFSAWIHAEKNYVLSLNNWLKKGLNYKPEITEDGPAPYSPGRLELSPIFIILNNWSKIIDKKISEVNAVKAIKSLYSGILQLLEKQKLEQHQMQTAYKNLKAIRTMEREERLFLKELKAKNRKFKSPSSRNNVYLDRTELGSGSAPDTNSLKTNLRLIFQFMKIFASYNARGQMGDGYSSSAVSQSTSYRGRIFLPPPADPSEVFQRNAIGKLVGTVHEDMAAMRCATEAENDGLCSVQAELKRREKELSRGLREMTEGKYMLKQQLQMVLMNADLIEGWVKDNERKRRREIDIDDVFLPADELSRQMMECTAADLAAEDTIYALDKAVQDGAIPFETYLKSVRMLSREQFFHRAAQVQAQVASMAARAPQHG